MITSEDVSARGTHDTHPLHRLVLRERAGLTARSEVQTWALSAAITSPFRAAKATSLLREASALDCVHAVHDVAFEPGSGVTSAMLELRVRANGVPLASIGLELDAGLALSRISVDGRDVLVEERIIAPSRVVHLALSPPLEPDAETTMRVEYGGALACGAAENGTVHCVKDAGFSYFAQPSLVPLVFDPTAPYAPFDGMTRETTLRVPASIDAIATGEKVSETVEGTVRISRWSVGKPLSRDLGMYVFAGTLGKQLVSGRSVPTTFVYPAPELPIDARLVSWSGPVLDFVEALGGAPLPFKSSLTLVRLPSNVGDPGTATFGMTLLSETYARAGDLMFEETWAHENAHLLWGITVPERSPVESRLLSEGLATLSQLDYTYARHFGTLDRDRYLARRFAPIALDLRAGGGELPAVELQRGDTAPTALRTTQYMLWAYYKTAATLDHLRATIGDDAFSRGLTAYVARCSFAVCDADDFRSAMEAGSGRHLGAFFRRWVTGTSRPTVTVDFEAHATGAVVELAKADAVPMTLELWLTLENGEVIKQRAELAGTKTRIFVATSAPVRAVAASPRHDVLVDVRSVTSGDLDFDGEADGLDLLRCTRLVGRAYDSTSGLGLWNVDETFDPRCDADSDLHIDEADIAVLAASFGAMRAR